MSDPKPNEFEKASQEKQVGLVREIVDLLKHNKKWWLAPILIVLALIGVLLILGSTGAAPFIYTLF
jgi:hypothetical protein